MHTAKPSFFSFFLHSVPELYSDTLATTTSANIPPHHKTLQVPIGQLGAEIELALDAPSVQR
jgi:hypothetical protein